ncbi:hypothetical protein [Bradyrhizobium sp. USDA 4454]
MQNATVASLVYELLFEVYRKIDLDRKQGCLQSLPDENGTLHEAFYVEGSGHWEWPAGVLNQVGALKPLYEPNPPQWTTRLPGRSKIFFEPVMTLDECEAANFLKFETFDNYCVAMFSFEYLHSHFADRGGLVNLDIRSHRFLKAVASQDDIFAIEGPDRVRFEEARYQEKVLTRWRDGLDDRNIRSKTEA